MALGVFALAFGGLAVALDAAISAGLEARGVSSLRRTLESRLAYCLVDPPSPGDSPRKLEPEAANRFAIEETLTPRAVTNQDGKVLKGLYWLVIEAKEGAASGRVETLLYRP